jgi:hypothetical protein
MVSSRSTVTTEAGEFSRVGAVSASHHEHHFNLTGEFKGSFLALRCCAADGLKGPDNRPGLFQSLYNSVKIFHILGRLGQHPNLPPYLQETCLPGILHNLRLAISPTKDALHLRVVFVSYDYHLVAFVHQVTGNNLGSPDEGTGCVNNVQPAFPGGAQQFWTHPMGSNDKSTFSNLLYIINFLNTQFTQVGNNLGVVN